MLYFLFLHTDSPSLRSINDFDTPNSFLSSFSNPNLTYCSKSSASSLVFMSYTCASFFSLVPLYGLVLLIGMQKQHRRPLATTTISNCDLITYNIFVLELINLLACGIYLFGVHTVQHELMKTGISAVYLVFHGHLLFNCLTCAEQYLAVMHPVIYLSLKTERGLLARNAIVAFVWLVSFLTFIVSYLYAVNLPSVPYLLLFAIGLTIISYCTLSVLHALVRPGPGEVSGNKRKIDQMKKRACVTIAAIAGAMYVKYIGTVTCIALHALSVLEHSKGCVVLMLTFWFCMPSSVLMPLLFLYRAGKLPCFSS